MSEETLLLLLATSTSALALAVIVNFGNPSIFPSAIILWWMYIKGVD